MWTRFWNVGSGEGGLKSQYIYIEAPESEARTIFYNRFGCNADRVSCTCCGSSCAVTEGISLAGLTRPRYMPLDAYLARPDVLLIPATNIRESERTGDIPAQGWIQA